MKELLNYGPTIVTALGGLLVIVGSFWASHQSNIKDKAIADLNQEILNATTGGDSYAWLNTPGFSSDGSFAILVIHHDGKYILKNLRIKIAPLGDFRKVSGLSLMTIPVNPKSFKELQPSDLKKDTAIGLGNLDLTGKDAIGFNIFFETDHKKWSEQFRMLKIAGKWKRAIRVTDDETHKVLREIIDNGYPRNQNGEIEWYSSAKK